jgi:hypothetical protein
VVPRTAAVRHHHIYRVLLGPGGSYRSGSAGLHEAIDVMISATAACRFHAIIGAATLFSSIWKEKNNGMRTRRRTDRRTAASAFSKLGATAGCCGLRACMLLSASFPAASRHPAGTGVAALDRRRRHGVACMRRSIEARGGQPDNGGTPSPCPALDQ